LFRLGAIRNWTVDRPSKSTAERRAKRARNRVLNAVLELFSGSSPTVPDIGPPDLEGGLGVREPRRPLHPSLAGGVALDLPPAEGRDVWAVGEER
jgi:hypothetical protein